MSNQHTLRPNTLPKHVASIGVDLTYSNSNMSNLVIPVVASNYDFSSYT